MARRKPPVEAPDLKLLSKEEIAAAKAKAAREFNEQRKAKAVEQLVEFEKQEMARAADPGEEQIFIRVDLPEFCEEIRIDGVIYQQGWHGHVGKARYLSMQDCMARAWEHKLEIEGKKFPTRRKPRGDLFLSGETDVNTPVRAVLERRVF